MPRRAQRTALRATGVASVALAIALAVTGGCSNCPPCPKNTEPVQIAAPASSH